MAPSTNGTRKLGLRDLVPDVLILILVECEVPGVLAVSRTNKYFRRIALTRAVWYSLVSRLVQRGFIDSRPDDGYFRDLSTAQLIGLVRRMLHGPKAWTDTPSQSQSFPRSQTAVRRAVNRLRKFIRKPPLGGLGSAPLVESRRIVLHPEIDTAPGGLPDWHINRSKLLPGGKYVLFQNSGRVECWSVFEDRHIWTHTPSMDHTLVHDFAVDMLENGVAIILTCQRTEPQPKHFVEVTRLNLQTGVSNLELVSRLSKRPLDFLYADCMVCGDVAAVHLRVVHNQVLLINWRTSSRVVVSGHKSEIALVPGHLVVLTRTGTRDEHRVALSPFASFACWEPNDNVEQPSTPVVPVADLPFLPDTISPACKLYYTWKRSIWVYESPFQQGRFTLWLHALVNGAPTLLSYQFLQHDTGVSWRFVASTPMPDKIDPTAMSLSGHTLGYCGDYADCGIIAPFPVSKGSARRHIVDFGGPSTRLSPFSGALTFLTPTELVVVYYD